MSKELKPQPIFAYRGYEGWDELIRFEGFVVTAFSLQRLLYDINSGSPFAFITAWITKDRETGELIPIQENRENMGKMRKDISGFVDLRGAGQEDENVSFEPSFFVPGIDKDTAHALANKYGQDCVLWGQEGVSVLEINHKGEERVLESTPTFDLAKLGKYWSEWKGHAFSLLAKPSSCYYAFALPINMMGTWGIWLRLKNNLYKKYGAAKVNDAIAKINGGADPALVVQDLRKELPAGLDPIAEIEEDYQRENKK